VNQPFADSRLRDIERVSAGDSRPHEPRTALGRRLAAIRAKIVASGEPLLDFDEVEREVSERRTAQENEA